MGSTDIIAPHLPPYEKIDHAPNIQHNGVHGKDFADIIDSTYDELVKWRKNAFIVPTGKSGKNLLTFWLDHFNNNTESFYGPPQSPSTKTLDKQQGERTFSWDE